MSETTHGHSFEGVAHLDIDTDAAAVRVEVASGTATTVVLTDRNGAPLDELLELTQDGDVLRAKVRTVRGGTWKRNRRIDAHLAVTAPVAAAATIRTNAGSVKVARRTAPVHVEANVGSIELTAVAADVVVRTDAGSVKVADGIGNVVVNSDAGSINVQRQQGEYVELRATAGSVTAKALEVGTLEAHTDAGSVKIEHRTPPVSVVASCSVGAVTIELPNDDYDIEQQVGRLGRARLEGLESVPGAERTVRVRASGVGSVTVRATAPAPART